MITFQNPLTLILITLSSIILASCDSGGDADPITNSAPTFSSSSASISVQENTTGVIYTAQATDAEGNSINYALSGGVDQAKFSIDASSGELRFVSAPDYEVTDDDGRDRTYEVQISASDSLASSSMSLSVSITNVVEDGESNNRAPTASISVSPDPDSTTLTTATEITLNGSDSSDPDGDTLDYTWSQASNQSIDLSSTSAASTSFTAANPGTYTFTLTVDDGSLTDSAEITLEIIQADSTNRAPTASISVSPDPDSTTLTTATEITLNGSDSSDPDGDTLDYTWSQASNQSIDLSSTSTATTTFTAANPGTYTFTLSISDGELGDNSEAIVTIHPITLPTDFAAIAGDTQITLTWIPYSDDTFHNIYRSDNPNCDLININTCSTAAGQSELFSNVSSPFTDTGLTNATTYYYWIEAIHDGEIQLAENYISATPQESTTSEPTTYALNDTGITWGGDYSSGNNSDCSSNISAPQDCHQGRDAYSGTNDDSDGHAGFSFTKLDSSGNALTASATNWSCVQDNVTGLIWEVKTDDGSERDKDNAYRWGGLTAIGRDSSNREGSYYDDWNNLVNAANSGNGLCGFTDWRVPDIEELRSIVDYSRTNPSIDINYFPNTGSDWYWSASPDAYGSSYAWRLGFGVGYDYYGNRGSSNHVRLVRSGQ